MTTKTRNRLIVLFILTFPFMVLFGFLISQVAGPLPPIQPLPNPSGYDDLMKAGQMISTNTFGFEKMDEQQLQSLVDTNSSALQSARDALQMQCSVPIQFTEAYAANHFHDLSNLKRLAEAFAAEGKLAEMENRNDDAAKSYLDAFHLGNESMRGGNLIDGLVGIAIQAIGTSYLTSLAPKLDAASSHETAATLQALESQSPTWDKIIQQEHDWSHRTFTSIRYKIVRLINRKSLAAIEAVTKLKFRTEHAKTLLLIKNLIAK